MATQATYNGNGKNGTTWFYPVVVAIFITLINAFWAQAYSSIQSDLTRIREELEKKLTIREYNLYKETRAEGIAKLEGSLQDIRVEQIKRTPILSKVDDISRRLDTQNSRLAELQRTFGSIQPPGKVIDELRKDLQEIRQDLYRNRMPRAATAPERVQ